MTSSLVEVRHLLLSALVLTLAFGGTAAAQSYEYDWANALVEEFRFDDMAEEIYTGLTKRTDTELQMAGKLGLSGLKRKQARRESDVEARTKLNDEALAMLREVAKNIPSSDVKHYEAQIAIADTQIEIGSEVIDQIKRGVVPANRLEEIRKKVLNGLEEAQFVYEKIKAKYGDAELEEDQNGWRMARSAMLDSSTLKLRRAELIVAVDPSKKGSITWFNEIQNAKEELEGFIWEHEDQFVGMVAYLYYGRVLAQLVGVDSKVLPGAVEDAFLSIPGNLLMDPESPDWAPAPDHWQKLVQRSYHWMLEFLDERGLTSKTIEHGEKFKKTFEDLEYPLDTFGRMAMVQLARAYHADGRSSDALALAADISSVGGYVGSEADKLTSVIIKTSVDKSSFAPKTLAAGANGAFMARTEEKNLECIVLYQLVLQNLSKIEDPTERNDLGAKSWYRIGICFDRLDRLFESVVAFETGYARFNTDQIREDPKINATVSKAWRYASGRLVKAMPGSSYLGNIRAVATNTIISKPPKSPVQLVTDTKRLMWVKADGLYRLKKYEEARPIFAQLSGERSDYQERAMVRLGAIQVALLSANKNAKPADWIGAAVTFRKYKKYIQANPETDPQRRRSRRRARSNADFRLAQCLSKAAQGEEDLSNKQKYFREVVAATVGFDDITTDKSLKGFVRGLKIDALLALDNVDEAEQCYLGLVALDPLHTETTRQSLRIANALRAKAAAMPTNNVEGQVAMEAVSRRSGEAYKGWLLKRKSSSYKYWQLVFNIYYGLAESPQAVPEQRLKDYETAYELIGMALAKFEGTRRATADNIEYMKRKKAKCLLEKARAAYLAKDVENTDRLFKEAAALYDDLMKETSRYARSSTVREEAAMIYGGFLAGPDRRGNFDAFEGNGEFSKAQQLWAKVQQVVGRKQPKNAQEKRQFDFRRNQAYFYKFLMEFQMARSENNGAARMDRLRGQMKALKKKTNRPGGEHWFRQFEWLIGQVR